MSSAFLYLAIVAIWAFVLVPRWVRRSHLVGRENAEPEDVAEFDDTEQEPEPVTHKRRVRVQHDHRHDRAGLQSEPASAPPARGRAVQARRRLLLFLIALVAAAGACAYLKVAAWWVCVPPGLILGAYVLLLRSAALADAEQARRRVARDLRVQAARQRADEPAEYEDYVDYVDLAPTAEVIDISGRLGDQVYDQYADATIRAVGD